MKIEAYETIDEYLANFTGETLKKLQTIRTTVKEVAPEAKEKISYGIPTFTLNGNLVHFAGYDTHIGFYPGSGPIEKLADNLKDYKTSKGTVQFPLDKPLPLPLIHQLIEISVERNKRKKTSY